MDERGDIEEESVSLVKTAVLLVVFIAEVMAFHAVADPVRHPLATLIGEVACLCAGGFASSLVVSLVAWHVLSRGNRIP